MSPDRSKRQSLERSRLEAGTRSSSRRGGRGLDRTLVDHLVDYAEFHRHLGGQEIVALERVLDLLERLAGVVDVNFVETLLQVQNFLGVQHDVGRLALEST